MKKKSFILFKFQFLFSYSYEEFLKLTIYKGYYEWLDFEELLEIVNVLHTQPYPKK